MKRVWVTKVDADTSSTWSHRIADSEDNRHAVYCNTRQADMILGEPLITDEDRELVILTAEEFNDLCMGKKIRG